MGFCSAFTGPGPDEGPHFSQDMSHWGVHVTAVEKLLLLPPDPRVPEADFGSLGEMYFGVRDGLSHGQIRHLGTVRQKCGSL